MKDMHVRGRMKNSRRPILITGTHRSGSTWVGQMIAQAPRIAYIHEPFHIQHMPGICGAEFKHWFYYITKENEVFFLDSFKKTLCLKYNVRAEWRAGNIPAHWRRILRDFIKYRIWRLLSYRPLIKDPIAVFSAEWLASRFDMDVVVLIRHPAAFVGSLKRMGWTHPFSDFLAQPLLMRDHLHNFETELVEYAEQEHDIIDQGAMLWKIIHYVIKKYRDSHPNWLFIRHEDISMDPLKGFQHIFRRLAISMPGYVKSTIVDYSKPENPKAPSGAEEFMKRDSHENIHSWKRRLTAKEIQRIHQKTMDIANQFYREHEW